MARPTRNPQPPPPDPAEIEAALRGDVPPNSDALTPMTYLLGVLRDAKASPVRRDKAARTLARYLHRRR